MINICSSLLFYYFVALKRRIVDLANFNSFSSFSFTTWINCKAESLSSLEIRVDSVYANGKSGYNTLHELIENYYEEKCRDKLVHMHMDETVDDSANEK